MKNTRSAVRASRTKNEPTGPEALRPGQGPAQRLWTNTGVLTPTCDGETNYAKGLKNTRLRGFTPPRGQQPQTNRPLTRDSYGSGVPYQRSRVATSQGEVVAFVRSAER
ncbi:hypothetical protein MRX96_005028 [Rhipicephalus microplus]